jgi:hypothetical protein
MSQRTRSRLISHLDKKLKRTQVMGFILRNPIEIYEADELLEETPRFNMV